MSVILVPNVHAPAKETLPISQVPPHSMRSITFVDMAQESPCRSRRLVLEGGGNMRGMSALNFLSSFFWFFFGFFFYLLPRPRPPGGAGSHRRHLLRVRLCSAM